MFGVSEAAEVGRLAHGGRGLVAERGDREAGRPSRRIA